MSDKNIARDRYYKVIDPERIRVTLISKGPSHENSHAADLKEISSSGAVLLLTAGPEVESECELSLASPQLGMPLRISAKIEWLRPNPAGQWQMGCVFQPPLADEAFEKLWNSGLLERRATPREPARIQVQVELEPDSPRLSAVVHNISEGGLCCLTTSSPPKNTRQVSVFGSIGDEEVQIPLKIRWSTRAGDDYFIGCQFARKSDYAALRKIQSQQSKVGISKKVPVAIEFGQSNDHPARAVDECH